MNDTSLARELSRLRGAVQELTKEQHKANEIAIDIERRRTMRETRDIEEMDRNARAYGWQVGRSGTFPTDVTETTDDNPFVDPNWRDKLARSNNGAETG